MNKPQKITPFKHFCLSVGVIPSAYTEAMSYYELLEWLCQFLQGTVVPIVNNNSEVVTELQNYVSHYFDNLDIQTEINNKLDEMADNGTLAEIIAQYIQLQGLLCYNTVAEMKLAENLVNGSFALTFGYSAYNDGKGAKYKVREVTNQDVVDNINIIALADNSLVAELIHDDESILAFNSVSEMKANRGIFQGNLIQTYGFYAYGDGGASKYKVRVKTMNEVIDNVTIISLYNEDLVAELLINGTMYPEQFGAKGDNETDDHEAISLAIEKCNNIIFNNKTYLVADEIEITKNNLILNGNGATINFTGQDKACFRMIGSCDNIEICNFNAVGTVTADTSTYLQTFIGNNSLTNNSFTNINIHNNNVHNFSIGITINADLAGHLSNIIIHDNKVYDIFMSGPGRGYGIHISDGQDEDVKALIYNNDISVCSSHCLYIARGSGYTIFNNYIHDNHTELVSDLTPAVNLSRSKNILFTKNILANIHNGGVFFSSELRPAETYSLTAYPCENITIENNTFKGTTNQNMIMIGYGTPEDSFSKNINIINNNLDSCQIGIYGVDNLNLENNKFNMTTSLSAVVVYGVGENTYAYTDNIIINNNNFKIVENNVRPIRLNNNVLNRDTAITFIMNIVNYGKVITTQSNCSNNKIKIINQAFDNDFWFTSTYGFATVYVNGVDITQ